MLKPLLLSLALSVPALTITSVTFAANSTASNPSDAKTPPYGDNPNIFRVLTYKAGENLNRLGNSIQRGADKSSAKINEKWEDTKNFGQEQSQIAQQKASNAKSYTEQKWQQTKAAVAGDPSANVPIEQRSLSQPSTTASPAPSSAAPSGAVTTPLGESATP